MSKKKIFKVTKNYSRKVSLKGITSQYDNVTCGTFIYAPIEWIDEKDFNSKMEVLAKKVKDETERDIASAIGSLMDMAKDENNSALVGNGDNLEYTKFLSTQIDGFDDISPDDDTMSLPEDIEEVEGIGLDFGDE